MRAADTRVQWIAAGLLAVAGLVVCGVAWTGRAATSCRLPEDPRVLSVFADADGASRRSGFARDGIAEWLEASWKEGGESPARLRGHMVVAWDHSIFVVPPLTILPNTDLPSDRVERIVVESAGAGAPALVRINDTFNYPFVVAWIYALRGEPVEHPVRALLRRAFEEPFVAAPPMALLAADSRDGRVPPARRRREVEAKLGEVWRAWETACSS